MNGYCLLQCLFVISVYFLTVTDGYEAIVGGIIAGVTECYTIQYHVTILIADHAPRCGGGILSERFILTAAHCVITTNGQVIARPVSVLAGTCDLSVPGLVVQVEKIITLDDYDSAVHSIPIDDIAILKLRRPLELSNNFRKLQIPTNRTVYVNARARIAGLGWDKINENNTLIGEHSDNRLRFAEADIRNYTQCQQDHPNERIIAEKHMCARLRQSYRFSQRIGACMGDGGGPLVANKKVVIGVLSVTVANCSEATSSGIYTRVSYYRKFILDTVNDRMTWNMHIKHV